MKAAHNLKKLENFLKNSMKNFGLFLSKGSRQRKLFICVRAFFANKNRSVISTNMLQEFQTAQEEY